MESLYRGQTRGTDGAAGVSAEGLDEGAYAADFPMAPPSLSRAASRERWESAETTQRLPTRQLPPYFCA